MWGWTKKGVRGCRPPDRWAALADGGLALVFLVAPIVLTVTTGLPVTAGTVVAGLAGAAAVLTRRGFPVPAVLLGLVPLWLVPAVGVVLIVGLSYAAGYRIRRLKPAIAVLALVLIGAAWLSWPFPGVSASLSATYVFVFVGAPALVGRHRRQRRDLVLAGWEQARRQERVRIAGDMHDSLGHELSLIALQAGSLELDPDLPAAQRDIARTLRRNTTAAMDRLEDIIAVLREDTGGEAAGGTVADLVDRASAAGLRVRLEEAGGPPDLPVMADRAVYRVVQEALTNAAKHGRGGEVVVRVENADTGVVVEVSNPLGRTGHRETASGGSGLVGLAERVRLAGGRFRSGLEAGVFRVVAEFPRDPSAGATAAEPVPVTRRADFWVRVVLPIAAVLGILFALNTVTLYFRTGAKALDAETFAGFRLGEPQAGVQSRLPPSQVARQGDDRRCRYYGQRDGFATTSNNRYRLCFSGGRLVSKDVVK